MTTPDDQFFQNYQVFFFPITFLVDASGVIRQIFLGEPSEAEFRAQNEALIAGEF